MKNLILLLLIGIFASCVKNVEEQVNAIRDTVVIIEKQIDTVFIEKVIELDHSQSYFNERLPYWVIKSGTIVDSKINTRYTLDNRINPMYLEEDFNGDSYLDIVLPVKDDESGKLGFAVIHGRTFDVHIVGAGIQIKDCHFDEMSHVDIWMINRDKENMPGLNEYGDLDTNGPLILEIPSFNILKSELGGGLIYWDGNEYVYFHQTC